MEPRLDKLDAKLDDIIRIQADIQADLKNHIYRTEIAEENIEKLAVQMSPIQAHVAFVGALGKILSLATAIATIAGSIALFK